MTYTIVVGIDGSEHSEAALRWALAQAEAHQGEVTASAFDKDKLEQAAKNFLLETLSAVAPSPPVPLRSLVAEGDPAEALVAASKDADQLVVGSRGRAPFMGAVLGAVSLRCAATASCPVTLVKVPGEGQQDPPLAAD
jgi:nucleotide-binding universal stress UspA family protein